MRNMLCSLILYSFTLSFTELGFNPECTGNFNDDSTQFIIDCETAPGDQMIVRVEFSLNGVDMGESKKNSTHL